MSSFDYVTPRKLDQIDQPEQKRNQNAQIVNLERLGDSLMPIMNQDLKNVSLKKSSSKKFQD